MPNRRNKKITPSISFRKIHIFNTPITNVPPENIIHIIDTLITHDTAAQIVFLSWWEFIRATYRWEYKSLVRNATLVIPTSPLISFGARVLKREKLHCYSSFDFIIKVLSRVEAHNKYIYLLGMEMEEIEVVEKNIQNTFPNLGIVGRYSGYFSTSHENTIMTAVRKSGAKLLFAGNGVPHKEMWLYRVKHKIQPCITVWSGETMSVLASKKKKPPQAGAGLFFHSIRQGFIRPWRLYRALVFVWYLLALLYWRISNK